MHFGPRFDRAFLLASELHRHQLRKASRIPYISHLMAVAALVAEAGGGEDEVIAALLHDAPEDQGGQATVDHIRAEFGEVVANLVASCSDSLADTRDPGAAKAPWRERKERYIASLADASAFCRTITAADKLHNARCLVVDLRERGDEVWSLFKGGRDGTIWYFASILEQLETHGAPRRLVIDLAAAVDEMRRLAGV